PSKRGVSLWSLNRVSRRYWDCSGFRLSVERVLSTHQVEGWFSGAPDIEVRLVETGVRAPYEPDGSPLDVGLLEGYLLGQHDVPREHDVAEDRLADAPTASAAALKLRLMLSSAFQRNEDHRRHLRSGRFYFREKGAEIVEELTRGARVRA